VFVIPEGIDLNVTVGVGFACLEAEWKFTAL